LGSHILFLFVHISSSNMSKDLSLIFSHALNLVRLGGIPNPLYYDDHPPIDWDTFAALADTARPSLVQVRGLRFSRPTEAQSPSVFHSFTKIRSLDWGCSTRFDVNPAGISTKSLSTLEYLSGSFCDGTFFTVLSRMEYVSIS
jgi:hypothetical protein